MIATVIGINYTIKTDGTTTSTLHVAYDFSEYYKDEAANRHCTGKMVESIYVGAIDCSKIAVGSEVEITYGKAIAMKNGSFYQPIEAIRMSQK